MGEAGFNLFDLQAERVLLGRYRIDETMAHGPLSARFRVTDQETDAKLALELFTAGLFEGPGQANFFAERLRAFGAVHCKVVVPTHAVEVTEGGDVLRFCSVPGAHSLRQRLREETRLPREEVVTMVAALLEGLAEIHGESLAHGDLKPSNLFVDGAGVVTTEGGVTPGLWRAQHMGARTSLIGTPYYSPLEQFGGEAPDADADLYAVGTLAYEALSGVLPWEGKGYIEVFQAKMQDNPPPIESRASGVRVGDDLEKVIRKAMRARRGDRYRGAREFLEDWNAASHTSDS
ncbi:MAG: serine/threonine protein kinase [Planctomycetes bacterium]|nr:serine/threonine protein kinase [Planctomycetota bacterium]